MRAQAVANPCTSFLHRSASGDAERRLCACARSMNLGKFILLSLLFAQLKFRKSQDALSDLVLRSYDRNIRFWHVSSAVITNFLLKLVGTLGIGPRTSFLRRAWLRDAISRTRSICACARSRTLYFVLIRNAFYRWTTHANFNFNKIVQRPSLLALGLRKARCESSLPVN